jgi:TRAP-type C4-dicarboxylate transport system permease large subunit
MFIATAAIGMITPPVGTVLNTAVSVSNVPCASVAKGAMQFLLAELAILVLPVLFPSLVTVPASWFL